MLRVDDDLSERLSKRRQRTLEHQLNVLEEKPIDSLDHIINIRVSDAKLRDLKERTPLSRKFKTILGVWEPMSYNEFEHQIKRLYKCCLKSIRDLHELHIRRSIGMNILEDIVNRVDPDFLNISHVIHLIWCIMSCMHHFQLRLRTSESGLVSWARKRKSERCVMVYQKLIRVINKNMYRIAVNAIVTFYREGKLWEIEFACTALIIKILEIHRYVKEDLDDIVYTIEIATIDNPDEAKHLTKVLCEIMKYIQCPDITMYILIHIMNMLENSIKPKPTDTFSYVSLRKGMEICVRHAIKILERRELIKVMITVINKLNSNADNEEIIICFGNIAVYTAKKYNERGGRQSFVDGPLPMVLTLFRSKVTKMTLIGLKIWQSIVDRGKNAHHFVTPKIFFRNCEYNIVLKQCHPKDKALFKKVRHLIYAILIHSFLVSDNKAKLETVYQTIALTLIEIPCGYSVSCIVTIAMSIQEFAFSIMSRDLVRAHHLHATILSILTLICHIHHATVFYKYVNMIIERRAEWAPHLNPPLKMQYEYAQHHILWNKPELFFEDWEARYGLWKCFRDRMKKGRLKKKK
ncbi:uncharacterized protein LOC130892638 [Diorhabda carinulata]|uniref:uncharacterized protein LOC130892638 n=1 Tax=Diorhabda carinulata TaxID=1163345 RepID=UPI0025A2921D|nr:uncharacterized protein LOC130892638 [Diorhabda carinulata]